MRSFPRICAIQGKAIAGHPDGKVYKLNWAAADGEAPHTRARPKDYPVFVGDLSEEINDQLLLGAFYPKYSTVTSAKVVMDKGYPPRSKGFGFVRFSDDSERHRAIAEMNGAWLGTKMMRVSEAQSQREDRGSDYRDRGPRDDEPFGHQPDRGRAPKADDLEAAQDATNTTLFIGGLGSLSGRVTHRMQLGVSACMCEAHASPCVLVYLYCCVPVTFSSTCPRRMKIDGVATRDVLFWHK